MYRLDGVGHGRSTGADLSCHAYPRGVIEYENLH
jgi:hypothetical protein